MKKVFPELIGNEELRARFARSLLSERSDLPHAYIIEGARGTGKRTFAFSLVRALVCENRENADESALPCGKCRTCRNISKGACPDVIEIVKNGASVGVDTIRELRRDIHIRPNELERKIYIINDAHTMTVQAQNALLLTLEDPPPYAFLLLLCESSASLLETVRSRAPSLRIKPLDHEQTEHALLVSDPSLDNIKRGNPSLWNDVIMSANGSAGLAAELLAGNSSERISEIRRASERFCMLASDNSKGTELLMHVNSSCTSVREAAKEQLASFSLAVRDLVLLKRDPEAPLRFWADRERASMLSDRFSMRRLLSLSDALLEAISALDSNMNTKLTLISMLKNI